MLLCAVERGEEGVRTGTVSVTESPFPFLFPLAIPSTASDSPPATSLFSFSPCFPLPLSTHKMLHGQLAGGDGKDIQGCFLPQTLSRAQDYQTGLGETEPYMYI